jgi:hypothetical protein
VVTVIDVDEITETLAAATMVEVLAVSTKFTAVVSPATGLRKPVPVMVSDVPPAADPVAVPVLVAMLVTVGTTAPNAN